jgi:hypothetical protein
MDQAQWAEAFKRLCEARERLRSFDSYEAVKRNLNKKPGEVADMDFGYGEPTLQRMLKMRSGSFLSR